MSISSVKIDVRTRLWGKAAGRCQYRGCNKPLWLDSVTKAEFNTSYIAHIIANKPTGPRGDKILSAKLATDISNLMLLCDVHHRKIDIADLAGHPAPLLQLMKKEHEERIERLTCINPENQSHVILFGANIGDFSSPLRFNPVAEAMAESYGEYPADSWASEIGLNNSSFKDSTSKFWEIEEENLSLQFRQKIKPLLNTSPIQKYSVFALAPQPLLIKFGSLLRDLSNINVYQLFKEPTTWIWQEDGEEIKHSIDYNGKKGKNVALNLSLSGAINDSRIYQVLGANCPIWTITHPDPNNDYIRNRQHLRNFRQVARKVFNNIKTIHGEDAIIHVFPAMPISTAIELGRIRNPKADLPLVIYDQNRAKDASITPRFYRAISIDIT